jgi:2-succinyl-6-hydroxy-2,4-cyclohexadiene-1-carboxylate synthase
MNRIVALHGNLGGPEDWSAVKSMVPGDWITPNLWTEPEWETQPGDLLVGYSLGGRLALQRAVLQPERFRAVIVLSAHPGLKTDQERAERIQQDLQWAQWCRELPWREFLARWDAQSVLGDSAVDRGWLEAHREAIAQGFENWSLGRQPDLRANLQRLRCPLVWMTGAKDAKFTKLAAEAGVGTHVVVPEAGHRLLQEGAETVGEILRKMHLA